ncbi:MAG: chemotaxis protein CheW [Desulfobacteraceae bacterium]|jgi:chemotaxis signal transduction protein
MLKLVLFQTGDIEFALHRERIDNIQSIPPGSVQIQRSQQQTVEYEGGPLILVDLAPGANHCTPSPPEPDAKMIMLKGSPPFALLADDVKESLEVDPAQMDELPPVFAGTARACFPKVLFQGAKLVLIVDTDALANCKIDFDPALETDQERQNDFETHPATPTTERTLPFRPPAVPSASVPLEEKVEEILHKIIEQRVEKKVAETMAQTLETSFW